ncbi:MAG: RpiB/LacA/LacB family sugar-phosphate isomerase [Candidatus Paceibacterota bacterium]
MKIYLGADHAGFQLKEEIKAFLLEQSYNVSDEGAYKYQSGDDYPDFIGLVAVQVAAEPESRGLIFGGSGQGEAMAANRYKGVRAVVYYGSVPLRPDTPAGEADILQLSRRHNDANVLSLGARFVDPAEARVAVVKWLETDFSGDERHIRRIKKIEGLVHDENVF